jgi:hypothetical protein
MLVELSDGRLSQPQVFIDFIVVAGTSSTSSDASIVFAFFSEETLETAGRHSEWCRATKISIRSNIESIDQKQQMWTSEIINCPECVGKLDCRRMELLAKFCRNCNLQTSLSKLQFILIPSGSSKVMSMALITCICEKNIMNEYIPSDLDSFPFSLRKINVRFTSTHLLFIIGQNPHG